MKISHVLAMIALVPLAMAQTPSRTATGGKAAPAGGYIRFGNAAGVPPTIGFAGDLAGTSVSQTVVGIMGHPLPPLTGTGYLHWNGTAWVLDTPSGGGGGGGGGAITVNGAVTTYPLNFNDSFPPPSIYGLNVQWKFGSGQISAAIYGDGDPSHCFLGNGQFAPCPSSSGGGGMTWPTGGAGIPNYSGANSWGTSYSATNQIPTAFIPTLNQNTTGSAGTALALASTPTLCTTGQAPTGILANGNATGCAAIGGGSSGVNPGTAQQIAYYATTGSTVSGNTNLTDNGSTLSYTGAGGVSSTSYTGTGSAFSINTVDQSTTPANPVSGHTLSYSKAGAWCSLSPAGAEKCVGTGGGGGTTRTWNYTFQGVCQGAVASASVNFPLTNSPSYVPCTATNITPEWQIPAGNTTDTFWIRIKVPTGHTGAYTLTTTFRSVALGSSGSVILQPTVACVAPTGASPDNPTFSGSGISTITLTPSSTSNTNMTATGTFTPTCADGADLYVMYTFTTNTLASPMNFSYVGLAITANL